MLFISLYPLCRLRNVGCYSTLIVMVVAYTRLSPLSAISPTSLTNRTFCQTNRISTVHTVHGYLYPAWIPGEHLVAATTQTGYTNAPTKHASPAGNARLNASSFRADHHVHGVAENKRTVCLPRSGRGRGRKRDVGSAVVLAC